MHSLDLEHDFFIGIITDMAANMNSLGREIKEQWNIKYYICVSTALIIYYSLLLLQHFLVLYNYAEVTSIGCLKKTHGLVSHINSSTETKKTSKASR
jgi:hypothetical protein